MSLSKETLEAFRNSLFAQKKKRVYKPKIKVINLDYNCQGHLFSQTGYQKGKVSSAGGATVKTIARIWTCSKCGLVGIQNNPLERTISLAKAYVDVSCPEDNSMVSALMQPKGKVILTRPFPEDFGLAEGQICDIVTCPTEYMDRFAADIWVFSEQRNEPVRILKREYRLTT